MPFTSKKIYHLTPEGQLVVADWFQEETNVPTQRDEFLAKVYVIALFNQEQATSLLQDRRHHYQKHKNNTNIKRKNTTPLQIQSKNRRIWAATSS